MRRVTDRQTTITASGITAGGRRHNTEQPYEGVSMLTTEETTHRTTTTGTFDAASRLCTAWQWLETQRQTAPEGADVWDIRWQAQQSTTYLLHTLQAGEYRLSPLQLHGQGEDRKAVRSAQDALVLKWVALSIEGQLPLHPACEHVKGHGGGRQSVHRLHALLTGTPPEHTPEHTTDTPKKTAGYAWVCRTDIRGYYRNISKETLLNQVSRHVTSPVHRDLIYQYLHYTVEDGGAFHTPEKGISRGCALSPLMGALHLYDMDEHFSRQKGIHYARYMDDIVILAKTRWSLRKHTKRLMQWFSEYGFEAHPDKTQIGRTAKGFDWMGAWLTHEGVTDIAPRAKANHREKVRRLYERLARVPDWLRHRRQQQVHARVSAYRKRWNIWAGAILAIGAMTLNAGDASGAELSLTNYPTILPASGVIGENLGNGSITFSYVGPVASPAGAKPRSILGIWTNTTGRSGGARTVNGVSYILPLQDCPSIGLRPSSYDIIFDPLTSKATSPSIVRITGIPPAGPNRLYGTLAPTIDVGGPKSTGDYWPLNPAGTIWGTWTLLDATDDPGFLCASTNKAAKLMYGFEKNTTGTLAGDGAILASSTPRENLDSGGWISVAAGSTPGSPITPPVVRTECKFTSAAPLNIGFPGEISPADINKTANSKVIAKASSNINLSITCSGDMTGVQPVVELQWTKSAPLGGTGGLRIGVANDVADDSNGILLSTADSAVGAYGNCGTVPTGYDMCGAYYITPGTPLTLYPVVFRNTNTADKARSGVHTVTGTLKVVVP